MSSPEQNAILTIAMLAAFADGTQDEREREALRRMAESLARDHETPELTQIYQDVLLKRVDLHQAAATLNEAPQRQLAYEMAVCICDVDGPANAAERAFLDQLRNALGLAAPQTASVEHDAQTVAIAPLADSGPAPATSDAELDRYILNHAIVNGAIELLPQ